MMNDNLKPRTRTRSHSAAQPEEMSTVSEPAQDAPPPDAPEHPIRERSAADQTVDRAMSEGLSGGNPRDPNKGSRPPRVPMGKGMNLNVGAYLLDKAKYHYRWVTEKPHRPGSLAAAKGAYYEHCTDHEGNVISRPTGAGVTYLMRLPIEYWKEDLARKRADVQRTLDEQTKLGPKEYAPTTTDREGGDSSMVERSTSDNPYAS